MRCDHLTLVRADVPEAPRKSNDRSGTPLNKMLEPMKAVAKLLLVLLFGVVLFCVGEVPFIR